MCLIFVPRKPQVFAAPCPTKNLIYFAEASAEAFPSACAGKILRKQTSRTQENAFAKPKFMLNFEINSRKNYVLTLCIFAQNSLPSNNSLNPPKTPSKYAHSTQKFALRQTICLFRPKVGVIKLIPLKSLPSSSYANSTQTIYSLCETERHREKPREKPKETQRDRERHREKPKDTARETERNLERPGETPGETERNRQI